ncbi:MAG: hypothetical protein ACKVHO_15725 [Verrucomicrobiia bacterium]|jgi:hypothetical protein
MSLNASRNQLVAITKDLHNNWEQTRALWRDQKAADFERLYMRDVESAVSSAVNVMQELDELIQQVKRDCE